MLDDVGSGDKSGEGGEEVDCVAHREVGGAIADGEDWSVEGERLDHAALSVRRRHRRRGVITLIRSAGIEAKCDGVHVAWRQSEMKRHSQQRVPESAADEHDLHAEPAESIDGFERAGCERVDIRAREGVDFVAAGANGVEPKTVDVLERNAALHRIVCQVRNAPSDEISASSGKPINPFDPAHRRIDVQDDGTECGRR